MGKPRSTLELRPGEVDLAGAVALTRYSRWTIYELTSRDSIPFVKRRGRLVFRVEELMKWVEVRDS